MKKHSAFNTLGSYVPPPNIVQPPPPVRCNALLDVAKASFIEGWLAGYSTNEPMNEQEKLNQASDDWRGSDAERMASNDKAHGRETAKENE